VRNYNVRDQWLSVAAGPLQAHEDEPTEPGTPTDTDLYAGPDEHLASDAQYAFGGDTEIDNEVADCPHPTQPP
jgi:hypothetical protein